MAKAELIEGIGYQYPECPYAEPSSIPDSVWDKGKERVIVCCHSNPCPESMGLCASNTERGTCPFNRPVIEENVRKRKVQKALQKSWENTIDPKNQFLTKLSRSTVILAGFTEISGYLVACKEFKLIGDSDLRNFREYYQIMCDRELKDEFYATKRAIIKKR